MAKNILFAIRSLNAGGAERQFILTVKELAKIGYKITVVVFYNGAWDYEIKNINGIKLINLNKKSRYDTIYTLYNAVKLIKSNHFDIIYSFLPEMNITMLIAKFLSFKKPKIFWGIRSSNISGKYGAISDLVLKIQALLSPYPDIIIFNSNSGKEIYLSQGFKPKKIAVIHNAIDLEKYNINSNKRADFRANNNLKESDIAIGIAARIDKAKGYKTFAKVAKNILEKFENVKFFVAGSGDKSIQAECENFVNSDRLLWLGKLNDMSYFYNGIDIAISTSTFGEGFSNSIAEAMACGKHCVVTNVGDSALIADGISKVAEAEDDQALSEYLKNLIDTKAYKDNSPRERIANNFSVNMYIEQLTKILEQQ